MAQPEPWRKTGRKAKPEHFLGITEGVVLEVSLYDNRGSQQGRGVIQLLEKMRGEEEIEGQIWRGRFLCIEDGYYEWWAETVFGRALVPFHLCERNAQQCTQASVYRNPVHVDVFRVLPMRSFESLAWMTDARREKINNIYVPPDQPRPGIGGAGAGTPGTGVLDPGRTGLHEEAGEVRPGAEGISGLAAALGSAERERGPDEAVEEKRKRKHTIDADEEKSKKAGDLKRVIEERKAKDPMGSALKMKSESSRKNKKKKEKSSKEKKKKKKRKSKDDGDMSVSSDDDDSRSSSSSEESVFRLAALPEGVDRLHRIHQERPGALADMTLRRFQELLSRAIGGGTAMDDVRLPAVARAYLSQIYLVRNTEAAIGLRNLRELRTLTTLIDLMASNDILRALDVAVQRVKSIELFISQGQWNQANLLELILPEDEQRAWFRQELKAAQQEHRSEVKMQQDSWSRRPRTSWNPNYSPRAPGEKKEGEAKDDQPPGNSGGKGKTGKGKGRKGKAKW